MSVRSVVVAFVVGLSLVGCGGGVEQQELGTIASELRDESLRRARKATAKYHDVLNAEGDGYVAVSPCVESPDGFMGIHYLNFALIDGVVKEETPELLLYQPTDDGLRLVGVEYMVPILDANGQPYTGEAPPPNPGAAPVLFGQTFHGPMPGHGPGEPWHYDLHVWIWSQNPAGTFAVWNPALSCGG